MPASIQTGLLEGVDNIIDNWFSLYDERYGRPPKFRSVTAAKACRRPYTPLPLNEMIKRIEDNWKNAGKKEGSNANWRWTKNLEMSPKNSGEKELEKLAAFFLGDEWANQIPVCSGLTAKKEGKMAIDLAREISPGEIEFVELKFADSSITPEKCGDSHPMFAAFEILKYGLVYLFAREKDLIPKQKKQTRIRCAQKIHLVVLAPANFYTPYSFQWLQEAINQALKGQLTENHHNLTMDFCFKQLADKFAQPYRQLLNSVCQFRVNFTDYTSVKWN